MNKPIKLRIPGLTKADILELRRETDPALFSIEQERLPAGRHGEPVTVGIVIISVAALNVLAAWLLRTHHGQSFRHTIETVDKDGKTTRETIEYKAGSSEAPKESVLRQLAHISQVDAKLFIEPDKNA